MLQWQQSIINVFICRVFSKCSFLCQRCFPFPGVVWVRLAVRFHQCAYVCVGRRLQSVVDDKKGSRTMLSTHMRPTYCSLGPGARYIFFLWIGCCSLEVGPLPYCALQKVERKRKDPTGECRKSSRFVATSEIEFHDKCYYHVDVYYFFLARITHGYLYFKYAVARR